jgi:hypothetical protein
VTERLQCERCGIRDGTVAVRRLRTQEAPLCDVCDASLRGRLTPQPSRVIVVAFILSMVAFVVVSAIVIVLVS